MLTRREVLRGVLAAVPAWSDTKKPEILTERHLLSEESGGHFHEMLRRCEVVPGNLIVMPGAREMSEERAARLRARAVGGAWVILESGLCFASEGKRLEKTGVWERAFGLKFAGNAKVSELFVEYEWPVRQLVRGFDGGTLLESGAETIAWSGGKPVCCRRKMGKGGLLFLGSMLGPGMGAGEREAELVGRGLAAAIRAELGG